MMRSMYSGVSGLRAHQLKMDIIGNNIANVNTVGFKGQRVTFQEVYNQTIKGAGSPQAGKGGTNSQQVGLGISLASIDTFHMRGAVQRTDNTTDLAINGDGFFITSDSADYLSRSYTRAGNFNLDEDGNLVAANGYKVLGYMLDPNTGVMKSSLEGIKISKATADDAKASTYGPFEGNLNNAIAKATTAPDYTPGAGAVADNLDFKGNAKWETTYQFIDSLGGKHNIKFTYVRGLKPDGTAGGGDTDWSVFVQDLDTGKFFVKPTAPTDPYKESADGSTKLDNLAIPITFGSGGKLTATSTKALNLMIAGKNGAQSFPVNVDLSALTQFAGESNAVITKDDGYAQGFLDTYTIGPTGEINAVFTNGQNKVIGRIALAVFKNPAGLDKTSENMYKVTPNSGAAIVGLPGQGSMGALNPGTLEMSNVDISREFTEMISTQRGFQANSRIITTSDEMLQELVNLKR
jgi:flagellar hook protein FlgE